MDFLRMLAADEKLFTRLSRNGPFNEEVELWTDRKMRYEAQYAMTRAILVGDSPRAIETKIVEDMRRDAMMAKEMLTYYRRLQAYWLVKHGGRKRLRRFRKNSPPPPPPTRSE